MSLDQPAPPPAPRDEKLLPLVGWITYICGFAFVGLIIAYIDRDNATPMVRDNYRYMIRTFWIALLYGFVLMSITIFLLVRSISLNAPGGFDGAKGGTAGPETMLGSMFAMQFVFLLFGLWFIARSIRGLIALVRETPIRRPGTWLI